MVVTEAALAVNNVQHLIESAGKCQRVSVGWNDIGRSIGIGNALIGGCICRIAGS